MMRWRFWKPVFIIGIKFPVTFIKPSVDGENSWFQKLDMISCKLVVLNLFWSMDHLFKKNISDGPLCYVDTAWTTTVVETVLHIVQWTQGLRTRSCSILVLNKKSKTLWTTRNFQWSTDVLLDQVDDHWCMQFFRRVRKAPI